MVIFFYYLFKIFVEVSTFIISHLLYFFIFLGDILTKPHFAANNNIFFFIHMYVCVYFLFIYLCTLVLLCIFINGSSIRYRFEFVMSFNPLRYVYSSSLLQLNKQHFVATLWSRVLTSTLTNDRA